MKGQPTKPESQAGVARRDFVRGMAALPAMGATLEAFQAKPASTSRFVAIQVAANTILDEGIERCLDLMQETAAINVIVVQSHTYYASDRLHSKRSPGCLAPDHGIPVRDPATRRLPFVWVKHREEYFRGTVLRHPVPTRDLEYADHNLFAELVQPCRKRGIRIYPRLLDPFSSEFVEVIPNWTKVLGTDIHGRLGPTTCYHNPDYRMWWLGTVEDMFRNYELDGLQWGAECVGPLSNLMFNGTTPFCFCEHCRARGRQQGIDVERARRGFQELHGFVQKLRRGERPPGGALAGIMNHFFRYPEILAWERLWRQGKEELMEQVYGAVKAINPNIEVGQHVDHAGSTYDIFYRHFSSDPEKVYRAVHRAYDAGANGVMLSRQYDEMRIPNLRSAGRAIRERAPA